MKINKTLILIPLLLVVVVSLSGCITDNLTKTGETFESNGVVFQYPTDWQVVNSVAEGSMAAVASKEDSNISVVIQQAPSELGTDIQTACSNNNKNLVKSPNYINVQEVQSTVNEKNVILHRYIVNEPDGSQKEHVATWMQCSDGKIYVLLFSTPLESYESQRANYDLVVSSFRLAGDEEIDDGSLETEIKNRLNQFFTS